MHSKLSLRQVRIFSEPLKKKVVRDIESGKMSVLAVSRDYQVSFQAVYGWLNKYSRHLQSSRRIVVEMNSETNKSKELEKRIKELEAALGRKQLEIDYLNKMIQISSEEAGVDLKKKFGTPPSSGSGSIKDSTGTK
jgi:transposase-like protein